MITYAIIDNEGNVYGVVDSESKARVACVKLKEKDSNTFFDYIECPMNEIEFEGEVIYRG
jgi:hypothetical protein